MATSKENILNFCKYCRNQKFDPKQGVICGITNFRPGFDETCPNYNEDSYLKQNDDRSFVKSGVSDNEVGSGIRLAIFFVDYIVFFLILIFLMIVYAVIDYEGFIKITDDMNRATEYLMTFLTFFIYYVFFEGIWGRSIGKLITGTKVVDEKGEKPDIGTIVVRTFCRFIPFDHFSFLGERGWHDSISKTYVVKKTKAAQIEQP